MDEFRQSDEQTAEIEAYEAEIAMKNRKFRARCIQWDRTDDDGKEVDVDLPAEVIVTLEDLQLHKNATQEEIEDELSVYLSDYYGFCHYGYFFDEVSDQ